MDEEQCPEAHNISDISVECWEVLLPGVWELSRVNGIRTLILVWKGWLGPCHWETSRDQSSCCVFTPVAEASLVSPGSSSFSEPPGTVWAMWSAFSGGRWSKLQSSLFEGLKPLLFLHEQVVLFFPCFCFPRPHAHMGKQRHILWETQHCHAFEYSFSPNLC